jgi:hypothetical protein
LKTGQIAQTAQSGNKLLFDIEIHSLYSTLKHFSITSFDTENGTEILFDTTPNSTNYKHILVYEVPSFLSDSMLVSLTMNAVDYDNNSFQLKCFITVTGGAQLLPELTGIVMWSALSGKPNALSLQNPSNVFLSNLADSADIDIYDYTSEEIHGTSISRELRTNTDVYFAKANNFNYSTATKVSVKNAFQSSISDKSVTELTANDVILFCLRDSIYGVIQISEVVDNDNTNNDYYRFSIKISS